MKNSKCYANLLDDCCEKISKEHILSQSIMERVVRIVGGKGIPDINISLNSAVAKILCRNHNSLLSVYDNEAAKYIMAASYFSHVSRECKFDNNWMYLRIDNIKGRLFEKWLIKTSINLIHLMGGNCRSVSNRILNYLFGKQDLLFPHGMWVVQNEKMVDVKSDNYLAFSAAPILLASNNDIGGFVFRIKGIVFILWYPWVPKEEILEKCIILENPILDKINTDNRDWHIQEYDIVIDGFWGEKIIQTVKFSYE